MILDALAAEKDVEFALERINIESVFVAATAGESSQYFLKQICARLAQWRDASELNFSTLSVAPGQGSVDALLKLYEALAAAHMIEDVPSKSDNLPEEVE